MFGVGVKEIDDHHSVLNIEIFWSEIKPPIYGKDGFHTSAEAMV